MTFRISRGAAAVLSAIILSTAAWSAVANAGLHAPGDGPSYQEIVVKERAEHWRLTHQQAPAVDDGTAQAAD